MIENFYVGQRVCNYKVVEERDVRLFAELSGDFNSLHLNEKKAARSVFGQRVCHGMLIGSYISAILGMQLPGEGTVYLGQELKFENPVFYNEKIEIIVEITEIIESKKIIYLSTNVIKENGTVAVSGVAKVKINL